MFRVFILVLVVEMAMACLAAHYHPEPIADEDEHLLDLERFARLGWTTEAHQGRRAYSGSLGYYVAAKLYRGWPSLAAVRWYSLVTMSLGLAGAGWLARRCTGSWFPGIMLLLAPHTTLCMAAFKTEGGALLMVVAGLLCLDSGLKSGRGKAAGGLFLGAGVFLAAAVLHRQTWVIVPVGLIGVGLLSHWRLHLAGVRTACLMAGGASLVIAAMVGFVTGASVPGTFSHDPSQSKLAMGNWLLSYLAFLPWYGAGLWAASLAPGDDRRHRLKLFGCSAVVASGLVAWVVSQDLSHFWLGHGPINSVLGIFKWSWLKAACLLLFSTLGLYLLLGLASRVLRDASSSAAGTFVLGCLVSLGCVLAVVRLPTTWYERYMLTPLFCLAATLPGTLARPWHRSLQCGLFLCLQLGVNYRNELLDWMFP